MNDDVSFLLADALAMRATVPPLPGGDWQLPALAPESTLSPQVLTTIATAYLLAELETSGLIVCADAVVEARSSLRVSYALMARIERHVELQRRCPTTLEREAFFVRLFGLGPHARIEERGNHWFLPRFSELCGALGAMTLSGVGAPPRTFAEERARGALERLAAELSLAAHGDLFIVNRIGELATAAVAILSDAELASLLGVTGLNAVVRTLVGGVAVELPLAYRRGRTGQAVLEACMRLLPRLRQRELVEPTDPIVGHAVQWLASYGVADPRQPLPAARGGVA